IALVALYVGFYKLGEPPELVEPDVQRDERNPERRHGDPGEGGHPQDAIGGAVASKPGEHAGPDADDRREDDRVERELSGRRDELAEIVRDRVVRQRRLAEVAVHEVVEVEEVAGRERPVEPVVVLEGGHRRRVAGGLLAQIRRYGVARDELR